MPDFGPAGGTGGFDFDEVAPEGSKIFLLLIRHGQPPVGPPRNVIIGIQAFYLNVTTGAALVGDPHGGTTGGFLDSVALGAGEVFTEISGRTEQFVNSMTVTTSLPRVLGRFGGPGGDSDYEFPPSNGPQEIVGFFGRSGALIDAIGVHTRPRT